MTKSARASAIRIRQPPLYSRVGFPCMSPSKPRPLSSCAARASALSESISSSLSYTSFSVMPSSFSVSSSPSTSVCSVASSHSRSPSACRPPAAASARRPRSPARRAPCEELGQRDQPLGEVAQQRRLADAVAADEAVLEALVEREHRVVEELLLPRAHPDAVDPQVEAHRLPLRRRRPRALEEGQLVERHRCALLRRPALLGLRRLALGRGGRLRRRRRPPPPHRRRRRRRRRRRLLAALLAGVGRALARRALRLRRQPLRLPRRRRQLLLLLRQLLLEELLVALVQPAADAHAGVQHALSLFLGHLGVELRALRRCDLFGLVLPELGHGDDGFAPRRSLHSSLCARARSAAPSCRCEQLRAASIQAARAHTFPQ